MMKMRNLLLGFILGLLTAVHSTPVHTGTSIPPKAEDDVYEEAMTEGFIVEHYSGPSVTTETSQKNTAIQTSVQPPLDVMSEGRGESPPSMFSEVGVGHANNASHAEGPTFTKDYNSDGSFSSLTTASTELSTTTQASLQTSSDLMTEGSAETPHPTLFEEDSGDSTTISASHTERVTIFGNSDDSVSSTIQTFQSDLTSLAVPQEAHSSNIEATPSTSDVTNSFNLLSDLGSGESKSENAGMGEGTTVTTSLNFTAADILKKITKQVQHVENSQAIRGPEADMQPDHPKGHNTPDWIIIVGFLVGLAALVMLCAAIATKDKWNAPKQPSENSTKTNSSNQKMELEMQTFLQKDEPKEEGKDSEYTVIPLDELPENYSSD